MRDPNNIFNLISFNPAVYDNMCEYDSDFISKIRMPLSQFNDYYKSIYELKEKYKDQIEIKIGLECEYYPKYTNWLKEFAKENNFRGLGYKHINTTYMKGSDFVERGKFRAVRNEIEEKHGGETIVVYRRNNHMLPWYEDYIKDVKEAVKGMYCRTLVNNLDGGLCVCVPKNKKNEILISGNNEKEDWDWYISDSKLVVSKMVENGTIYDDRGKKDRIRDYDLKELYAKEQEEISEEVLEEDGAKIVKLTKNNWNKYFEPIFPQMGNLEVNFCNSKNVYLVRAADIIANHFYNIVIKNGGNLIDHHNTFIYRLPADYICSFGIESLKINQEITI